jgi:hypothetical protein
VTGIPQRVVPGIEDRRRQGIVCRRRYQPARMDTPPKGLAEGDTVHRIRSRSFESGSYRPQARAATRPPLPPRSPMGRS